MHGISSRIVHHAQLANDNKLPYICVLKSIHVYVSLANLIELDPLAGRVDDLRLA